MLDVICSNAQSMGVKLIFCLTILIFRGVGSITRYETAAQRRPA